MRALTHVPRSRALLDVAQRHTSPVCRSPGSRCAAAPRVARRASCRRCCCYHDTNRDMTCDATVATAFKRRPGPIWTGGEDAGIPLLSKPSGFLPCALTAVAFAEALLVAHSLLRLHTTDPGDSIGELLGGQPVRQNLHAVRGLERRPCRLHPRALEPRAARHASDLSVDSRWRGELKTLRSGGLDQDVLLSDSEEVQRGACVKQDAHEDVLLSAVEPGNSGASSSHWSTPSSDSSAR